MAWLMIVFRLVHIVCGVIWVGFAVFAAFYLLPAMAEAGPNAAAVMAGLERRGILKIIPAMALATVLTGFGLYSHLSRVAPAFGGSPMGITLGIGGILALIALLIGLSVISPSMNRAAKTMTRAAAATGDERQTLMAQAATLRARGAAASRIVAWLLILAAAAMAVGRYA